MFRKAERNQIKLKIALAGPSGTGKTYSSLLLAEGLAGEDGKIAVIDTENNSASLYSDHFAFDTMSLEPPFSVEKYIQAINLAVKEKYSVLVLDSISHEWSGEGGLISAKETLDQKTRGNNFANWAPITKLHEQFKSAIIFAPIHIIATIRMKTEYTLTSDDKGKQAPKKVGLGLVQRDGIEYEFTTLFELNHDHAAVCTKDRTGLYSDKVLVITKDVGRDYRNWHLSGKPLEIGATPPAEKPAEKPRDAITVIKELQAELKMPDEYFVNMIKTRFQQTDVSMLTRTQHAELYKQMLTLKQ